MRAGRGHRRRLQDPPVELVALQVGLGEPAVAVSLTTQEEAPSGPPRGVRVEAVSSTQLRVTWQVRS